MLVTLRCGAGPTWATRATPCLQPSPSPPPSTIRDKTGEGQAVSTSIVNAGLLHTSYAWIHADGSESDWGHVDGDQFGLSPYYRLYPCALGRMDLPGRDHERVAGEATSAGSRRPDGRRRRVGGCCGSARTSRVRWRPRRSVPSTTGVCPSRWSTNSSAGDLFDDPEARRLRLVSETWSSHVGRFEDPGLLVNIRPAEPVIQRGPCACGEQTREILIELGYCRRRDRRHGREPCRPGRSHMTE